MMKSRVQKWGNSLALRIPKSFADEVGLKQDTPVEISFRGGRLLVKPLVATAPTLDKLLEQVNDQNLHAAIDTGKALGRETW